MNYYTEVEREEEYETSSILECSHDGLSLYTVEERTPAAAVEEIIGKFPHFMQYLCRKAILANEPFVIDAEMIGAGEWFVTHCFRVMSICLHSFGPDFRQEYFNSVSPKVGTGGYCANKKRTIISRLNVEQVLTTKQASESKRQKTINKFIHYIADSPKRIIFAIGYNELFEIVKMK